MATGRKTVVVGQVIDPDVWGNLVWDQSVQQFASDADRTAQFPTGSRKPGVVTWLDDVKRWEGWDGAAWVILGPAPYGYFTRTTSLAPINSGAVVPNATYDTAVGRDVTQAAGIITLARAGVYTVSFGMEWSVSAAGSRQAFLTLNGAVVPGNVVLSDKRAPVPGANASSSGGSITRPFAANDKLQLAFYQDSGAVLASSTTAPFFTSVSWEGPS